MGVKNLWDILESCKKTLPLHHLQNKRVCIDLSCWMVQLQSVNKSYCAIKDKVYLKGLFHRLRALLALNCSLIFVSDGSIPAIKLAAYRKRLNSGAEVAQEDTNSQKPSSLRRNMGSEFSGMIKEAKILGLALGIPCLDGIEEAEAQCALLNSESLCDGCFTSDSDVFLFGAKTVYRDISLGEGGHVVCYEMAEIERKLGFGRNSLITLALLLGSDYSAGVHGLGPESACKLVKSVGDDKILQEVASQGLSLVKKSKCSKKQKQTSNCHKDLNSLDAENDAHGKENCFGRQNPFLQVIDAYLKPKCHSADSDAVYRVLVPHTFQRAKLQEACSQFFGWPPEKTDEYILPKIAERDLRRFANLRSTSSGLGVNASLYEVPVKCPVSGIVKPRKVQGRECYEVLWEGIDGLTTAIVPADLMERACPEKINEYEERRAAGKRQNQRKPRAKKSESISPKTAIDSELQKLLLDINNTGGDSTFGADFPARPVISDMTTDLVVDSRNQCNSRTSSSSDSNLNITYSGTKSIAEHEVIDLLSPSPLRRPLSVLKRQELNDLPISTVDLSDSENEMSPEHMKKARELRLFIASIKDDRF
ncbi:hypothetical protein Tsubulata_008106 [Turnera subulata]|uniref:Single-strand DNA endonuclease 1 n=1 Tax=Turnera subulata TaxID=218843 RepID=A0A9Q0G6I1_9ROSI|nr:hypothetical protein Tsubulata_008106 [Turnera subulata]